MKRVILMMTMTGIKKIVIMMMTMTRIMKMVVLMSAGTTYVTAKETSQLKEVHIEAAIPCEMKLFIETSFCNALGKGEQFFYCYKRHIRLTRASGGIISTFKTHGIGPKPIEKAVTKIRRLT